MVNPRELRKTLGEVMGKKGGPYRARRVAKRRAARQVEQAREEPPRAVEVRDRTPPVVNIKLEEEIERPEEQLKTRRRKDKRRRAKVGGPSPPQGAEGASQSMGQIRGSGYTDCVVAKECMKKLLEEEGSGFLSDSQPEDDFDMALYNAYKAALLSADAAARVQRMACILLEEHRRNVNMMESTSLLEARVKKAEEEKVTAEMKHAQAESLLEILRKCISDLEGELELSNRTIDVLNRRVSELEIAAPRIGQDAVNAFLKTKEFERMVKVDAAESYQVGFETC